MKSKAQECRPGVPHRESAQRTMGTDMAGGRLVMTSCTECGASIVRAASRAEDEANLRDLAARGAAGRGGPTVMSKRYRVGAGLLVGLPVGVVVAVVVVGLVFVLGRAPLGEPILSVFAAVGLPEQVGIAVLLVVMGVCAVAIVGWSVVITPEVLKSRSDSHARTEAYVAKHLGPVASGNVATTSKIERPGEDD